LAEHTGDAEMIQVINVLKKGDIEDYHSFLPVDSILKENFCRIFLSELQQQNCLWARLDSYVPLST
jgi:hypothetical protein